MAAGRIGEFLRARRELVRPGDVGLRDDGRRRVPGLRRDELAMLAGISTEYYTRLEQGRDEHPSGQVLDAVARALALDADATAHLHGLARSAATRRRPVARRPETVRPSVRRLLETWRHTPAFIQGRHLDVLAANPLAMAVSPILTPGTNLLRTMILDPSARELMIDWDNGIAGLVAGLRALVGPDVDDPRLNDLVGELSVRSELFRTLWARHDVRVQHGAGTHRMRHPVVGDLELRYDKFAVNGSAGQTLIVYHADPGSPAEQALAFLGTVLT